MPPGCKGGGTLGAIRATLRWGKRNVAVVNEGSVSIVSSLDKRERG